MEIKIPEKKTFNVHIGSQVYSMRAPSVLEVEKFQEEAENGKASAVISFLEKLGLPQSVAKELDVSQMQVLIEGLTEINKKK